MRRIEFIRNISLFGAAAMLAPTMLVSASEKRILLDQSVHIPHGNFFESKENWVAIKEMNIECSVDQDLRNGVEDHELDLYVFKFRRGTEIMLISKGTNGFQSVGSVPDLVLAGSKLTSQSHVLELSSNSDFKLSRKA